MINQGQEYQYFKDKISHLEREVSRLSLTRTDNSK